MIAKLENGNVRVEEYSFAEFLTCFQEAVLAGYRLDLTSNENFPQKFGSHMVVTLVEASEVPLVVPDEIDDKIDALSYVEIKAEPVVQPKVESPVRRRRSSNE